MKYLFLSIFIVFFAASAFAQSEGFLVAGGDTLNVRLEVKKSGKGNIILFKRKGETDAHEVTAENASEAYIPGKWKYISVKLPSLQEKVWAKCFFDGDYQLIQFKSAFYLVSSTETVKLTEPKMGKDQNLFKGQMKAVLFKQLDYNYQTLNYNSKSLVLPLIELHKNEGLNYVDYNRYVNVDKATVINIEYSNVGASYYTNELMKIEPAGNGIGVGISRSFSYPDWSKRFSFIVGARFNFYRFGQYLKNENIYGTNYTEFSNNFYDARLQGLLSYSIVDNNFIFLSFQAGIETGMAFGPNSQVRIENVEDDVVQTSFDKLVVSNALNLYQVDRLVLGIPRLSRDFYAGIGGSFAILQPAKKASTMSVKQSLSVSLYYQF